CRRASRRKPTVRAPGEMLPGPISSELRSGCLAARAVAFLALLVRAPGAEASLIRVPADQPTIQAAVAAAASGDEILIAPGTYQGGVFVTGKSLTFASWYTL